MPLFGQRMREPHSCNYRQQAGWRTGSGRSHRVAEFIPLQNEAEVLSFSWSA